MHSSAVVMYLRALDHIVRGIQVVMRRPCEVLIGRDVHVMSVAPRASAETNGTGCAAYGTIASPHSNGCELERVAVVDGAAATQFLEPA